MVSIPPRDMYQNSRANWPIVITISSSTCSSSGSALTSSTGVWNIALTGVVPSARPSATAITTSQNTTSTTRLSRNLVQAVNRRSVYRPTRPNTRSVQNLLYRALCSQTRKCSCRANSRQASTSTQRCAAATCWAACPRVASGA